ncbi:MAG: ROK family protein [Roseiflexaceae bacterium]|nr:ROK family protein [Roseiflexaceae bacterium]
MGRLRSGSKQLLRGINRNIVLTCVKQHRAISRVRIAELTSLAAPTVGEIVGLLLEEGLVVETSAVVSERRGPRPMLLAFNPHGGYAIGAMLRPDGVSLVLTDLAGTILHHASAAFNGGAAPESVVPQVAVAARALIQAKGLAFEQVRGLGVGVTGVVDSVHGVVREAYLLGWHGVPIGALLQQQLGMPVYVDNDTRTLMVAEQHFGLAQDRAQCLLLTIGRGIGMAALVNGELLRGHRDSGAEFGHITVAPDGPLCPCGKRGCLEAVASDIGILERALAAGLVGPDSTIELLVERAAMEPAVRQLFSHAGHALGVAIANLITLFGPELVILTGEGLRANALLLDPLLAALPACTFGTRLEQTEIAIKPWNPSWEPWARGAACLVLDHMLRLPLHEPPTAAVA